MNWLSKLWRLQRKAVKSPALPQIQQSKPLCIEINEEYNALRARLLRIPSEALEVGSSGDRALGLLMETGYSDSVMALAAEADGTAGVYFSNGGRVAPEPWPETLRNAAETFLARSLRFVRDLSPTVTFPLPACGHVQFFLVTAGQILTADSSENDLGYDRHTLSPLFHEAHQLIAAIRKPPALPNHE